MADGLIILSLVTIFVLGCLGAGWYGNRLKARTRSDIELLYLRLRTALAMSAFILPVLLLSSVMQHNRPLYARLLAPGIVSVSAAFLVFSFLRVRKKYRELPEFRRWEIKRETMAFFWQAILILLPVAGLAGFGLYSLRQDRLFAGQEAREAGRILAQGLVQAVRTEGNQQLLDYRNARASICTPTSRVIWGCPRGLAVRRMKATRGNISRPGSGKTRILICTRCPWWTRQSTQNRNGPKPCRRSLRNGWLN